MIAQNLEKILVQIVSDLLEPNVLQFLYNLIKNNYLHDNYIYNDYIMNSVRPNHIRTTICSNLEMEKIGLRTRVLYGQIVQNPP